MSSCCCSIACKNFPDTCPCQQREGHDCDGRTRECSRECRCDCLAQAQFEKDSRPGCCLTAMFVDQEERRKKLDAQLCVVCKVNPRTIRLLPCNDFCLCGLCGANLVGGAQQPCPACKCNYTGWERVSHCESSKRFKNATVVYL